MITCNVERVITVLQDIYISFLKKMNATSSYNRNDKKERLKTGALVAGEAYTPKVKNSYVGRE